MTLNNFRTILSKCVGATSFCSMILLIVEMYFQHVQMQIILYCLFCKETRTCYTSASRCTPRIQCRVISFMFIL